jgi:anti-sigma factor RsiW
MTAPRDCIYLERTHAFADGELAGAAADDARDHLATCEACQAELADVLQLDAAVADRKAAGVISLAWYRRRHLQFAGVALAA